MEAGILEKVLSRRYGKPITSHPGRYGCESLEP